MNDEQANPAAPLPPHVLEGRSYQATVPTVDSRLAEVATPMNNSSKPLPVSKMTRRQFGWLIVYIVGFAVFFMILVAIYYGLSHLIAIGGQMT